MADLVLATAVVQARLDTSMLDKQIRTIGSSAGSLSRTFSKISRALGVVAVPLVGGATAGFMKFLKTTDPLAIKTAKSLDSLKDSFGQFLARVGERVVVKFDLVRVFERLKNVLDNISTKQIDKVLNVAKWLTISYAIAKITAGVFGLVKGVTDLYSAITKIAGIKAGIGALAPSVGSGLGVAGGTAAGILGVRAVSGSFLKAAIESKKASDHINDAMARYDKKAGPRPAGWLSPPPFRFPVLPKGQVAGPDGTIPNLFGTPKTSILPAIAKTSGALIGLAAVLALLGTEGKSSGEKMISGFSNFFKGLGFIFEIIMIPIVGIAQALKALVEKIVDLIVNGKNSTVAWGDIWEPIKSIPKDWGKEWDKVMDPQYWTSKGITSPESNKQYDIIGKDKGKFGTVGLAGLNEVLQQFYSERNKTDVLSRSVQVAESQLSVLRKIEQNTAAKPQYKPVPQTEPGIYDVSGKETVFKPSKSKIGTSIMIY